MALRNFGNQIAAWTGEAAPRPGTRTGALRVYGAMTNAAKISADPSRADVDHLLDQSRQHERQLAEICKDDQLQEQKFEYLLGRCRQQERQLDELCDKWRVVTELLGQQGRQISGVNDGVKTLDGAVKTLAADLLLVRRLRSAAAMLGDVLCWLGVGAASILLGIGIWRFTQVIQSDGQPPGAWFIPAALIGLSIVAVWIVTGLRDGLALPRQPAAIRSNRGVVAAVTAAARVARRKSA